MKPKGTNYSSIDWSKGNQEIAKEVGVTTKTIYLARKRRGIPPARFGYGKGNRDATIDHTLSPTNKPASKNYKYQSLSAWRRAVKRYYGNCCINCGYDKPEISNHCHHVLPKSKGGVHTISNAIVLCSRCHDELHAGLIEL